MAHTISFKTARFDPAKELPNPVNPIAGQALLLWLREHLAAAGWTATEPAAEDWGWYMYASRDAAHYLIGASGDADLPDEPATARHAPQPRDIEWVVQIERRRSLTDKLLGRNKPAPSDPLTAALAGWIGAEPDFREVEVDRGA